MEAPLVLGAARKGMATDLLRFPRLKLRSGDSWLLVPGDEAARAAVERARVILGLREDSDAAIRVEFSTSNQPEYVDCSVSTQHGRRLIRHRLSWEDERLGELARVRETVAVLVRLAERNGALLLHAGLAEVNGRGVLLVGPSGVGKTTTSRRMQAPWVSRSDDQTLVVEDASGSCWAHPWPTWSRVAQFDSEQTWQVERALPLDALFFLQQGPESRGNAIGRGEAVCRLVMACEQVYPAQRWTPKVRHHVRRRWLDRACEVAGQVPAFNLQVSLQGPFWEEMERLLEGTTGALERRTLTP